MVAKKIRCTYWQPFSNQQLAQLIAERVAVVEQQVVVLGQVAGPQVC